MATDVVDWELAVATGSRLAPRGPHLPLDETREVVAGLRALAGQAVRPVREASRLRAPDNGPGAVVVDRREWIRSNVDAFRFVLDPMLDRVRATVLPEGEESADLTTQVGSRVTGMQLGGVLAWLSGRVLGQYEALRPPGSEPRLLLVAPNMVKVAAALEVDQRDFQLWVCLHEETHRVQFSAVPWMAGYMAEQVRDLMSGAQLESGELLRRIGAVIVALGRVLGGREDTTAVLRAVQAPEQRVIFDRLMALMTLLEGHADWVMDEVGPAVVPSVAVIRQRFDARRANPGPVDGVVRRLLGMDSKLKQYSEGAQFVRTVVAEVGVEGFNQVWSSPEALPSLDEIKTPRAWASRVRT